MHIKKTSNELIFGSRNCPIEPFTIKTVRGPLLVEELKKKDGWKTAKFAVDCTLNSIPPYIYGHNVDYISRLISIALFKLSDSLTLNKKDGNSTILIAKDIEGKIRAFISWASLYKIPKCPKEECEKIGYGSDILVDKKYRNMGVGQILSDKVLKAAEGHFSDIIIHGNYSAINFHKRNGFEPLDISDPKISRIVSHIGNTGNENCIIMSKSFDPQNPWYKRIAKYY